MGYTIRLAGAEIDCRSAEEAAALLRALGRVPGAPNGSQEEPMPPSEGRQRTVRVLELIRATGSKGIGTKALAEKLNVDSRSLGPMSRTFHKEVSAVGIDPDKLFQFEEGDGERIWKVDQRLAADALRLMI